MIYTFNTLNHFKNITSFSFDSLRLALGIFSISVSLTLPVQLVHKIESIGLDDTHKYVDLTSLKYFLLNELVILIHENKTLCRVVLMLHWEI